MLHHQHYEGLYRTSPIGYSNMKPAKKEKTLAKKKPCTCLDTGIAQVTERNPYFKFCTCEAATWKKRLISEILLTVRL